MNYNAIAWKLLQFHNVPQRITELEESFDKIDIDRWNIRLNMLDEQITDVLLHAKKSVGNLELAKWIILQN